MGKYFKYIKPFIPYGLVRQPDPDSWFSPRSAIHPPIYDGEGKELSIYYLEDEFTFCTPYSLIYGFFPKTFIWDRFNRSLPVQFYCHQAMRNTSKWAQKKYGILKESEQIAFEDYDWIMNNPGVASEFDTIFTHSSKVLDRYSNAKFLPANGLWYGVDFSEEHNLEAIQKGKRKNICMIASAKAMCTLHKRRLDTALKLDKSGIVDVYGNAVGRHIDSKDDVLNNHRYCVAIENDITPYYFTEKLLDCFASKTVPIYLGATEIEKWFNTDGIIQLKIEDLDDIESVLKKCNETDYNDRVKAIEDNYQRVKKFQCIEYYLSDVYGF